jgi:hypothetical protein
LVAQSFSTSRSADRPQQAQPSAHVIVAIVALLLSFDVSSFSYAGLYADGSNCLLHMIMSRGLFVVAWSRIGAEFVTQSPVILAIHLGNRSIADLAALYTASLMVVPIASLCATTWFTRHKFLASAANMAVVCCVYYPTMFDAVGEFQLLYSLFWLSAVLVLLAESLTAITVVVLALAAVVMAATYELAVVTGPLLAGACIVRALKRPAGTSILIWAGLAVLFVAATPIALGSLLAPRDPTNEGAFSGEFAHFYNNWTLYYLAGIVVLSSAAAALRSRWMALLAGVAAVAVAAHFVARSLGAGVAPDRLLLGFQDAQRAQVFPYLLAAFAALVLSCLQPWDSIKGMRAWLAFPVLIVFALHLAEVAAWRAYVNTFCIEVAGPTKASRDHAAFLARNDVRRLGWDWELPTMSLLLRPPGSYALVVNPAYHGWQPFDPVTGLPNITDFRRSRGVCGRQATSG